MRILNELLADLVELHLKTKQIPWDLSAAKFGALHSLCEHVVRRLDDAADIIASRVSQRGGTTFEIERTVVWRACAPPNPSDGSAVDQRLRGLFRSLSNFTSALGKAIYAVLALRDRETSQLLTEVKAASESFLWAIEEYSWMSLEGQFAESPKGSLRGPCDIKLATPRAERFAKAQR